MKVIAFSRIIVVLALAGAVPLTAGTSPATRTAATSPPAATQVSRTATRIGVNRGSTTSTARTSTTGTTITVSASGSSSSCLTCHYSVAASVASTPHQCTGCHGASALNHAAAPDDPSAIPSVSVQATVCAVCHSSSQRPVYPEWTSSGHSEVTPGALSAMRLSSANLKICGACHSGSVRMALLDGRNPATASDGLNVPVVCVVCHDQHAATGNPAQLRNPVASTNNFHLLIADASSASAFKAKAAARVNLCAQCHNDRGAAWTDSTAPHASVQYNYLLGAVGMLSGGPATFNPGVHSGLPSAASESLSGTFYLANQCVDCHMQAPANGPASAHSHDTFTLKYGVCANCHDGQLAQTIFTPVFSNEVVSVISGLNIWAATKAPAALRIGGTVAWEYSTPGGLFWQTNFSGFVASWTQNSQVPFKGPSLANQALIPDNIKKARFDLYLFVNDGSLGVHNPTLSIGLLSAAEDFILDELNQ